MTMLNKIGIKSDTCRTAFKEWAITIDALARGEQIIILRKGGIHEPNLHFEIEHNRFLFFPGYLHQNADLLKPRYRPLLGNEQQHDPSRVTLSLYAEVTEVIELELSEAKSATDALEPFHIWAPGYALKRVHWKPLHELNVIILRCYKTEIPTTIPVLPEYSGCTSWVNLESQVPLGKMTPVISDKDFEQQVKEVRSAIASARKTA